MTSRSSRHLLALLLFSSACVEGLDLSVAHDLADNALWAPTDLEDDPWSDHRPDEVQCGPLGAYLEDGAFEVNTGACNYLSAWQPSAVALPAGTELEIALTHNDLIAEEPAEAHVALQLGDEALWSETVPIPSFATPYTPRVTVQQAHDAGEPLRFHLHNHGANNWRLLFVRTAVVGSP